MKLVLQRVKKGSVAIDGKIKGSIGCGFVALVGFGPNDDSSVLAPMADKMLNLRVFEDDAGKMNLSLLDVGGSVLSISQFTLYADCRKGNRPSFVQAAPPALANQLYAHFQAYCKQTIPIVESGIFGADMQVQLCNDGPFTVFLDSKELKLH